MEIDAGLVPFARRRQWCDERPKPISVDNSRDIRANTNLRCASSSTCLHAFWSVDEVPGRQACWRKDPDIGSVAQISNEMIGERFSRAMNDPPTCIARQRVGGYAMGRPWAWSSLERAHNTVRSGAEIAIVGPNSYQPLSQIKVSLGSPDLGPRALSVVPPSKRRATSALLGAVSCEHVRSAIA